MKRGFPRSDAAAARRDTGEKARRGGGGAFESFSAGHPSIFCSEGVAPLLRDMESCSHGRKHFWGKETMGTFSRVNGSACWWFDFEGFSALLLGLVFVCHLENGSEDV